MKRKIAIVGGGMAGLAAAFDLACTQELRDRYEVTIYQMGWRLGGKAASSRRTDGRIVEHGLHIWFGGYQNAFELLRAAYEAWSPGPPQAFKTWDQAFEKRDETIIVGTGDQAKFSKIAWPKADGSPGAEGQRLTLWDAVEQLLIVLQKQYDDYKGEGAPRDFDVPERLVALARQADVRLHAAGRRAVGGHYSLVVFFDSGVEATAHWAQSFRKRPELRSDEQIRGFVQYLRLLSSQFWDEKNFDGKKGSPFLRELVEVGTTLLKGVLLDIALGGATVDDLDGADFREWLCGLGGRREAVYGSSIVQSLYDTTFQYVDGDKRRPSFGAGTAAQVSLRLLGGYRDGFAYESKAGLGEVAIVPIFRALKKWNVKFKFFHRLSGIKLEVDGLAVAELHFAEQVKLNKEVYEPTCQPKPEFGNLEYWPDEPLWDQIVGGEPRDKPDYESYWQDSRADGVILIGGQDFHDVVLAVPGGALKPRKDDQGPCKDLIEAKRRFGQMIAAVSTTPTLSLQAWCTKTLAEMVYPAAADSAPTCSGPTPLNIWADRTALLSYENPKAYSEAPKSLQYLCDVLETPFFASARSRIDAPQQAAAYARELVKRWLEDSSRVLWPAGSPIGKFDWSLLFDPDNGASDKRLNFQVVKAHIDPWSCCVGSPAGSTKWRLGAAESGFANLYLAGSWIDSGFNVECIEAAVLSGRQAARAITGDEIEFDGENFLRLESRGDGVLCEIARGALGVLEIVAFALTSSRAGAGQ